MNVAILNGEPSLQLKSVSSMQGRMLSLMELVLMASTNEVRVRLNTRVYPADFDVLSKG